MPTEPSQAANENTAWGLFIGPAGGRGVRDEVTGQVIYAPVIDLPELLKERRHPVKL